MSASRLGLPAHGRLRLQMRWVVLASLIVGVFALHALADHDSVGMRHASVALPIAASTASVEAQTPTGDEPDATTATAFAGVTAPPHGPDESAAACILFLAGVAWVLALAVLYALRRRRSVWADRSSGVRPEHGMRGPPGCRLNISLCVLQL